MPKLTLAQVAYLSQQLTDQFTTVKETVVQASLELEEARKTLNYLLTDYGQWVDEEGLDHEQK